MAECDSARIAEVREEEQSRFGTGGDEDLSPQGGDRRPEDATPVQHAPSRGAEDWGGSESGPAAGGYGGVERGHGNYDTGAGGNVESVTFDPLDERGARDERGGRKGRGEGDRAGRDDRLKTMPGAGGEGPETLGQGQRPIGAVTHGLAEDQGLGGTQGVAGSEGTTGTAGVVQRHGKDT